MMGTFTKGIITVIIGVFATANAQSPSTLIIDAANPTVVRPAWDEQYVIAVTSYPTPTPPVVLRPAPSSSCSCVDGAKAMTGRTGEVWGIARSIVANIPVASASVGDLLLTTESSAGHVAVIASVSDAAFFIRECNWVPCKCTTRTVQRDDPVIRGARRLDE